MELLCERSGKAGPGARRRGGLVRSRKSMLVRGFSSGRSGAVWGVVGSAGSWVGVVCSGDMWGGEGW
ncbi:hypothetical protein M3J09_011774 [Ascochyta lentis]